MNSVFILNHLHVHPDADEDRLVGVHCAREVALAAIEKLRKTPGFCECPDLQFQAPDGSAELGGFYISERVLDETRWPDGFELANEDEAAAKPIAPMNDQHQAVVDSLGLEQLQAIDPAILREAQPRWHKVARIVGNLRSTWPAFPMEAPLQLFVQRIESLVGRGKLEALGDLRRIGYSEVRLAP
jgi:hypothetical protein